MPDQKNLKHLGIIPDGNRRWAKSHGLSSLKGHEKGSDIIEPICQQAFELGVETVSIWVFSTENWNRAVEEVSYLMGMFNKLLKTESVKLHKKDIRLLVSGSRERLSADLVRAIEEAENLTKGNSKGTINLCLNYGGQQEIIDAVNKLMASCKSKITKEDVTENLYHKLPPVDLIIRTSGEQRLSGFMSWSGGYSELYFVDKHWPDFLPQDIVRAVEEFNNKQRRFGGN